MNNVLLVVFGVIGIIVVAAGIGLLLAFPIMWCWNYAVVPIWHLQAITWGQAWCLHFLAGMFIKATQTNNNK